MTDVLIGVGIGVAVAAVAGWFLRAKLSRKPPEPEISHSLQQLKAVGELIAFKMVTQQIVTAEEHVAGSFGKNWLGWLLSSKKMAMVIEYGMDFKYDLRDKAFQIHEQADGGFKLVMPPCRYQTSIRNIKFYDESSSRWLPWLLGDLSGAVGPGFNEEDKNRLLDAARKEADEKANQLVEQLASEVESSARETMLSLARGFGADEVVVDFTESDLKQRGEVQVDQAVEEAAAEAVT